jgi:hypothetical protein
VGGGVNAHESAHVAEVIDFVIGTDASPEARVRARESLLWLAHRIRDQIIGGPTGADVEERFSPEAVPSAVELLRHAAAELDADPDAPPRGPQRVAALLRELAAEVETNSRMSPIGQDS